MVAFCDDRPDEGGKRVCFTETTWRYIPEGYQCHSHRRENQNLQKIELNVL
jgi:hypothetical protein